MRKRRNFNTFEWVRGCALEFTQIHRQTWTLHHWPIHINQRTTMGMLIEWVARPLASDSREDVMLMLPRFIVAQKRRKRAQDTRYLMWLIEMIYGKRLPLVLHLNCPLRRGKSKRAHSMFVYCNFYWQSPKAKSSLPSTCLLPINFSSAVWRITT